MPVLFLVGSVAVTVLEVDAEVLHRLTLQLRHDLGVDLSGESRVHPDRVDQIARGGEPFLHRAEGQITEPAGGVVLEQLCAAVDGVDRLAIGSLAREGRCHLLGHPAQTHAPISQ